MVKKCFIITLVLLLHSSFYAEQYSDLKSTVQNVSSYSTKNISQNMAPVMGFYTGSANMTGVITGADNTSSSPFWTIGLGAGAVLTPSFFSISSSINSLNNISFSDSASLSNSIDKIIKLFPSIPMPYDTLYGKIGIIDNSTDIGFRIGVIPPLNFNFNNIFLNTSGLHAGAEIRHSLFQFFDGLIQVDGRLSVDYDGGYINVSSQTNQDIMINGVDVGTNQIGVNFNYNWNGFSIGSKIEAGIHKKSIAGLYVGIGANYNPGSVSSALNFNIQYIPTIVGVMGQKDNISSQNTQSYNPFDFEFTAALSCFSFIWLLNTVYRAVILRPHFTR